MAKLSPTTLQLSLASGDWVFRRRCRWFWSAVQTARGEIQTAKARKDMDLLSEAWCEIGDVFDLLEAPEAAAEAYQTAVRLRPHFPYAMKELGRSYARAGRFGLARDTWKEALKTWPDDEEDIRYELEDQHHLTAEEQLGRRPWRVAEALARNKVDLARRLVRDPITPKEWGYHLCSVGAAGEREETLGAWVKASKEADSVWMNSATWFYLPSSVVNEPRYWRTLRRMLPKVDIISYSPCTHCSLGTSLYKRDYGRPGSKPKYRTAAEANHEPIRLMCYYHLARLSGDVKKAKELSERFPGWDNARALYRRLSRSQSNESRR